MRPKVLTISLISVFLFMSLFSGCKKDDGRRFAGTDTIDNALVLSGQIYAVYGFSFELGRVISNLESPGPDITVNLTTDLDKAVTGKYFDSNNLVESFALVEQYASASEAATAFDNLLETGTRLWELAAWNLEENQVWLFKTSEGNYVKIRITDIVVDAQQVPPFIELTFEWRIQPDGSTSFSE